MKSLHALNTGQTAWLWAHIRNLRGHIIPDQGGQYASHLYEVPRGQPPAIGRPNRARWNPFLGTRVDRDFMLRPLCGRLITRSAAPRFNLDVWGYNPQCITCTSIAQRRNIVPTRWNELAVADPWMQIEREDRAITLDPITGL